MKTAPIAFALALHWTCASADDYSFFERLVSAGRFDSNRALLMVPLHPKALALLFPGAGGDLKLSESEGGVRFGTSLNANFLVYSRGYFYDRDVAVLIVDSPTGAPMGAFGRIGALGGVKGLIEKARVMSPELNNVPVWAIGTSAGTISVAGLVGWAPEMLDGIVLTSAVTRPTGIGLWVDRNPNGVASMSIGSFKKPVLIVSHISDRCTDTPPSSAEALAARFASSVRKQVVIVDDPSPTSGDNCGPFSPHGFYQFEWKVVDLIVDFMLAGP